MDYPLYHYGLEDLNDTGFGCSYRNIQTFLSCYSRYYDNECIVPNIRDILYYFEKEYMKYIEQYRTRSLWIEPMQVGEYIEQYLAKNSTKYCSKVKCNNYMYVLKDSDTSRMLRTDIKEYINKSEQSIFTKDNLSIILNLMIDHFKHSKLQFFMATI